MKYKIYDGLSDYLIAPDGTAIHKDSAEVVPFQKTFLGITAKLITDETHTVLNGKRKAIRLVRRYTREEMLKMYSRSKKEFKDDLGEVPYTNKKVMKEAEERLTEKLKAFPIETGWVDSNDMTAQQKDIAIASMDHGEVSPLSIPSVHFLEEAGQITQKQMDQLSASKRTVKTNPKTKKSEVKKVTKALKKVNGSKDPVALKIPYFRIDGVEYQSARKAAEAVGVSVNTVLKRAKGNKDGWFYIES